MLTDRVYNLKKGDEFIYMGTKYRVTLTNDKSIYYSPIGEKNNCIRTWWVNHFGANSHARIEIKKKV